MIKVAFRKYPDGDVLALFPEVKADENGNIMSYQTVGQHGGASPDLLTELPQASEKEAQKLIGELIYSVGYDDLSPYDPCDPTPEVGTKYGAPMGRRSEHDGEMGEGDPKLYLRRVKMSPCGAYDSGGAYWAIGTPLYVAFDGFGLVRVFVRAKSRDAAKIIVSDLILGARFYH